MEEYITKEDLKALTAEKLKILIIDVRTKDEFENLHIPEAVNIELNELVKLVPFLSKDPQYILVCGKGGGRSSQGAALLSQSELGAKWLIGGTFGWFDQVDPIVINSNKKD